MKETIDFRPTVEEQQEYLAYKSDKDFFDNFETGLMKLKEISLCKDERRTVLVAGTMVAFDKGTIHFLNELSKHDKYRRYILLSEVT